MSSGKVEGIFFYFLGNLLYSFMSRLFSKFLDPLFHFTSIWCQSMVRKNNQNDEIKIIIRVSCEKIFNVKLVQFYLNHSLPLLFSCLLSKFKKFKISSISSLFIILSQIFTTHLKSQPQFKISTLSSATITNL